MTDPAATTVQPSQPELGWLGIMRLGLVQACIGSMVVLATSTDCLALSDSNHPAAIWTWIGSRRPAHALDSGRDIGPDSGRNRCGLRHGPDGQSIYRRCFAGHRRLYHDWHWCRRVRDIAFGTSGQAREPDAPSGGSDHRLADDDLWLCPYRRARW